MERQITDGNSSNRMTSVSLLLTRYAINTRGIKGQRAQWALLQAHGVRSCGCGMRVLKARCNAM